MPPTSFLLNGEPVEVPADALQLSAATFVRQHTQCKSIKVSCSEGGCGACAVEVLAPGAASVVALNACLLPVAALQGCHVITSEGLGNSRTGFHAVQARLAAFHGTQCGFCSPGVAVACHAALMAAAQKQTSSSAHGTGCKGRCGSSSSSSSSSAGDGGSATTTSACQQRGGSCDDSPAASGLSGESGAAAGRSSGVDGTCHVTAAELLQSLDGNLCRCTGWRPIADMAKSFACDVDIEDLGLCSLPPAQLGPISLQQLPPAALTQAGTSAQPIQQQQPQAQDTDAARMQAFSTALHQLRPGCVLAPATLEQVLQALAAARATGLPAHLLGGNTGAGLHPSQWQALASHVVVLLGGVRELRHVEVLPGAAAAAAAAQQGAAAAEATGAACSGAANSTTNGTANGVAPPCGSASKPANGHVSAKAGVAAAAATVPSAFSSKSGSGGPVLVAGAGATISRLLEVLREVAAPAATPAPATTAAAAAAGPAGAADRPSASGSAQQDQQQHSTQDNNLGYLVAHLRRLAGTLVRNAATLGGHLCLTRSAGLESDLAPILVAAGAEVCLTALDGSSAWLQVEEFLDDSQPTHDTTLLQQLDDGQAIISAVRLPLPLNQAGVGGAQQGSSTGSSNGDGSRICFWSHKLTSHRTFNEHAAVNCSIWLSGPAPVDHGGSSSSSDQPSLGQAAGYTLRIAVGTYQQQQQQEEEAAGENGQQSHSRQEQHAGTWRCTRAVHVEAAVLAALKQQTPGVLLRVLQQLPDLLAQDITPAGRLAPYVRRVGPGLLLKGLAVVLPQHHLSTDDRPSGPGGGGNAARLQALVREARLAALQDLSAAAGAAVPRGTQDLPIDLTAAPPLYWPAGKDGGELQASGEALYTDDVPISHGALHAAYVTSSVPYAKLLAVDWSAALEVPGVVGWVGPEDIPAGPDAVVQHPFVGAAQPMFAHDIVSYAGQALGLVVARTPAAAQAGASRVKATYAPVPSGGSSSSQRAAEAGELPAGGSGSSSSAQAGAESEEGAVVEGAGQGALTTLAAAVAADSWHDMSKFPSCEASKGDVPAALAASARVLSGRVLMGGQRHFYLEPQTAVATPDEGGRLHVVSSCQGADVVMLGICRALKLKHNQVHVTTKRVGGGFGGKAGASAFFATAAALAALKFRRQVRLVVGSRVDVGMTAGRCPMELDWSAGLDDAGRLTALQLEVLLMDGAFGGGMVEAVSMKSVADGCYDIPALSFRLRMARTNMPPRSTVRGPGKVSMCVLLELALQQLALKLGRDPDSFRLQHLLQLPQDALTAAAAAEAAAAGDTTAGAAPCQEQPPQACNGDASTQPPLPPAPQLLPHPKYVPEDCGASITTPLGSEVRARDYTLPYMFQQLLRSSGHAARRAAVDAFNAAHSVKKRGLAIVPVRFPLYGSPKVGRVSVYRDGSILLCSAGVEMGQGIATKIIQTAAHTLGQLLPPEQRPALLDHIRVAGGSTELMPHAGLAAGSTTSEGATAGIADACEQVVARLRPHAEQLAADGKVVTWEAVLGCVCGWEVLTTKVMLSAFGRAGFSDQEGPPPAGLYQGFGVGLAEVELDCLTGERALRAAALLFDAGRSISPAIDLGQVEGAFMQGVGYVMSEEVVEDEVSGSNLSNTTWAYKPPGIAELPKEFHVSVLRESPCHVTRLQHLSAKATGEPPMMMAAAVSCALQDAVAAAWRGYEQQQQQEEGAAQDGAVPCREAWPALQLPATTANILHALPPLLSG